MNERLLVPGTPAQETRKLVEITNEILGDYEAAFGGVGAVMWLIDDVPIHDIDIFYLDPPVVEVIYKVFSKLGVSIKRCGKQCLEISSVSGYKLTLRFFELAKSEVHVWKKFVEGNHFPSTRPIRVVENPLMVTIATAEMAANPCLETIAAFMWLFKKSYANSPVPLLMQSYFVKSFGSDRLASYLQDSCVTGHEALLEALPLDCFAPLLKKIEEYTELESFNGLSTKDNDSIEEIISRFREKTSLRAVNRSVCKAVAAAVQKEKGVICGPEGVLIDSDCEMIFTDIFVNIEAPKQLIYALDTPLAKCGVRVRTFMNHDHILLLYRFDGGEKAIRVYWTSEMLGIQMPPSYVLDKGPNVQINVVQCLKDLLGKLEQEQRAFDLVCFVEIADSFKREIRNEMPSLRALCQRCINSVEDFGMAIALDETNDEKLLDGLDIYEYLASFEGYAGVPVSPMERETTQLF